MMFRLVERPTLMPAQSLTGSTVGPQIDTERTLPKGGRVYVTPLEGWEIVVKDPDYEKQIGSRARELGWTSPEDHAAMNEQLAALASQVAEAVAGQPKVVTLEDALKLTQVSHAKTTKRAAAA